ncbi:hypothetical protein [Rhizobium sp. YTU87027]|uniref:hypothetical protein n=1 Tax=Rhizobium sp. YTU87027 TaxID=3417741 RepID=UPI003D68F885
MKSPSQPFRQLRFLTERRDRKRDGTQDQDAAIDQATLLEALLGTFPLPLFYKNSQGRYVCSNEAFEDFFAAPVTRSSGKWLDLDAKQSTDLHFGH